MKVLNFWYLDIENTVVFRKDKKNKDKKRQNLKA